MAAAMDLYAIDAAYGPQADLYRDVLGVRSNASAEQLQQAFWDQRRLLFGQLPDPRAERQMDALVLAARILSQQREDYDDVRMERMGKAVLGNSYSTESTAMSSTARADRMVAELHKKRKQKRRGLFRRKVESRQDSPIQAVNISIEDQPPSLKREQAAVDDTVDEGTVEDTIDGGTTIDEGTVLSEETTIVPRKGMERLRDEMCGAMEDTASSLEQIFNVFTLQKEDIQAVMARIDKAKRQMDKSF